LDPFGVALGAGLERNITNEMLIEIETTTSWDPLLHGNKKLHSQTALVFSAARLPTPVPLRASLERLCPLNHKRKVSDFLEVVTFPELLLIAAGFICLLAAYFAELFLWEYTQVVV